MVVIGNDPTCGPDMAHDWHKTIDGGGTLACTVPSDGREGRDRESIDLAQEQLVKQVYAVNTKVVVVLVSSFPCAINWSQEHAAAILHMTHSSQDEGTALAQVLFGDYNPAGRLTETWPKSLDQLPPMMDYNIRDGTVATRYMHNNPGKRGLVRSPEQWPWSSYRYYYLNDSSLLSMDALV